MFNTHHEDGKSSDVKHQEHHPHYWLGCSCVHAPRLKDLKLRHPDVSRLIINRDKLWNKRELRVFFLSGKTDIQNKIFAIAQEWEKVANVKFVRATSRFKSDIRVSISVDYSAWSLLGNDAEGYPLRATMHYGWFYTAKNPDDQEYHATVLHEFGHALGFEHELQHPFDVVPWDKEKVYAAYKDSQDWDKEEVDAQVLSLIPKEGNYLIDAKIDVNSIMCYEIEPNLLLDNTDLRFSNKRNHSLTTSDKQRAYTAYPFDFPAIGTTVKIGDKATVLQSFDTAERNDYIKEERDMYNGKQGTVVGHNLTNGIRVRFSDNKELWYEPLSLTVVSNPDNKPPVTPVRWFVGDRVSWSKATSQHNVGTIRYHLSNDDKLTILLGNQYINNVDPKDLQRSVFFYGLYYNDINPSLSLEPFPVGTSVKIFDDKIKVLRGFDMAGRSDYEDVMDNYCGKTGKVTAQHKTNGLQVTFEDGKSFWYEPSCFESKIKIDNERKNNRILVDSKVKITKKDDKYYNCVGQVCFNVDNDENIRVSIGDQIFLKYAYTYLQQVDSYFSS